MLAVIASMLAGTAATRADHTRIGSVTKTMIGTLVLELVDRHKLRLDESIAQWFPQLPEASQITIRKLFGFVPAFALLTWPPLWLVVVVVRSWLPVSL